MATTGKSARVTPLRPKLTCPECGRASQRDTFPFCSERCKNLDLNRWLSGAYAIPGEEVAPPESGSDD